MSLEAITTWFTDGVEKPSPTRNVSGAMREAQEQKVSASPIGANGQIPTFTPRQDHAELTKAVRTGKLEALAERE